MRRLDFRAADEGHSYLAKTVLTVAMFFILSGFGTMGLCADNSDTKLWMEQEISYGVSDALSLKLTVDERFYKSISTWEEIFFDVGVDYKPFDWLVLGPRIRHVKANFNSSDEVTENRYHMNVELIARLEKVTMESRSRYEYRTFKGLPTRHRFVQRLRVSALLPWEINAKPVEAYLSDEMNYDLDRDFLTHHEMMLGTKLTFSKVFGLKLFYGHELKKRNGSWDYNTHIIGITTTYSF